MLAYAYTFYICQHAPIHGFVLVFASDHNYLPMLDRINGPSRFNLPQAKVPDEGKTDSKTTVFVMQPVFPLRGFLP